MSELAATELSAPDIAARIEHDINIGILSPGAWLKQVDLERRYGCTRLDVRQALDALVGKRLVRHVPNRGYHVSEFDAQRINEIYEIRAILEVATAESIVANVTDEALERLRDRAAVFEHATNYGMLAEQNAANQAFHRELLLLCPNRELADLILEMRQRIPIAVQGRWSSGARMRKSISDHYRIIDAIAARDVAQLKLLIADHILNNRPDAARPRAHAAAG